MKTAISSWNEVLSFTDEGSVAQVPGTMRSIVMLVKRVASTRVGTLILNTNS